ncbi:hypothetical protein WIV_gp177 [Wiseana iridescent virus]|uniref:Uncharacterized protein n=1 Tax=Wiseana iridescent virus TaxID=68347 RepID=G0T5K3_IRV9|nr:hypothetical protein WIV_gp177 [Wiseana iridescent virus]ADO00521.1 hypothetical protein [Wiseana iridescent virus]
MKSLILLSTLVVLSQTAITRENVIEYLVNYGYLPTMNCTKYELRRSLRQLQREYNMVNRTGKITLEVENLVQIEFDKIMVTKYLKTFGYINEPVTPVKMTAAISLLQKNSGVLPITGSINPATVDFITSHPHGYSEGLYP